MPDPSARTRPCCDACGSGTVPAQTPKASRPVFPLFVAGALGLGVLLGISTGAWALYRMAFAAGTVMPSHLQLHAHVQILGFAGLFILGVALHALPRVLAVPPPAAALQRVVLFGVGGGVLLRAVGQPLAPWAAGRFLCLVSGFGELVGLLAFAAFAVPVLVARLRTGADRGAALDPLAAHALTGTLWAVTAVLLSAAQSLWLAGHPDPELPGRLVEPFYFVALYGFILSFVYGFASRMVVAFLGLRAPGAGRTKATLLLQTLGVLAFLASVLPAVAPPAGRALALAAAVLLSGSAATFLAGSGLLAARWSAADAPIRAAFAGLAAWALLFSGAALHELTTGRLAHKFVWDGARHVFTLGFLTLLVLAMATRVVPAFTGKALAYPRVARLALSLVGLGAFLRFLQVPIGLGWGGLGLYEAVGTMGFFVAAGVVLFCWVLWATLHPRKSPAPAAGLSLPARA